LILMPDRTTAPAYVQSVSFDLLQPNLKRLPNGVDLFLIHGGAQEVMKIEMLFKAGRWFETQWAASYFTSHQLNKGTPHKSSFDIAQLFDRYGAHLEVNAGLDNVSISLYTLNKNLQPVLALLREILQEPVFPEKELEQAKAIYIDNLKVNHEKTSFLASKHFRKSLFGESHPYGKEIEEADVAALQHAHLDSYFNTFFHDFAVFVSGKISPIQEKELTDVFAAWKTQRSPAKALEPVSPTPAHLHIEKEGSVQSSIRMGKHSVLRTDPDYVNAIFVSHLLGGYFGSRLMKNIREEKGLTYGIHASIHPMKHGSYLVIGADVNKENVNLTVEEIRKELRRLRLEKISQDELDTARNHFIGSLQSELTTPFAHADKLKTIYLFGLDTNYYQRMITTLLNLDHEQIIETAEQHFHEEKFFEIAAG
jgi:zinc protease